jgi:hypothetical protein
MIRAVISSLSCFSSKPEHVKLLLSTIREDVCGNGGIPPLSLDDETGLK